VVLLHTLPDVSNDYGVQEPAEAGSLGEVARGACGC
jgi:hypothetical protein